MSEKGQVTIPKQLRDRLGIEPGQQLEFSEEDGRLVARKVRPSAGIDAAWGILALDVSVDTFVEELRGPADVA
ncbi:MAG: AbrB/MazE/SpoVT family DNA-binding domain-containing protein [Kineosporiaceae bacterium]|nr:AbrB/MazE/SpoVT family DNA-binding domain-containing protein [Kineosporiaceae bacterium]